MNRKLQQTIAVLLISVMLDPLSLSASARSLPALSRSPVPFTFLFGHQAINSVPLFSKTGQMLPSTPVKSVREEAAKGTLPTPQPNLASGRMSLFTIDLMQAWEDTVSAGRIKSTVKHPETGHTIEFGLLIKDGAIEYYGKDLDTNEAFSAPVLTKHVGENIVNVIGFLRLKPGGGLAPLSGKRDLPPHDQATCSFCAGAISLARNPANPEGRKPTATIRPNGRVWNLYYNMSPITTLGHFLLVPDIDEQTNKRPQGLIDTDIEDLVLASLSSQNLAIMFNSPNAGASINHIHAQAFARPEPLMVEKQARTLLANVRGVDVSTLPNYEATTLVFEGSAAHIREVLWPIINRLQQPDARVPFDIYIAEGRVYLYLRPSGLETTLEIPTYIMGTPELSGWLSFPSQDLYDQATDERLTAARRHSTLPWVQTMALLGPYLKIAQADHREGQASSKQGQIVFTTVLATVWNFTSAFLLHVHQNNPAFAIPVLALIVAALPVLFSAYISWKLPEGINSITFNGKTGHFTEYGQLKGIVKLYVDAEESTHRWTTFRFSFLSRDPNELNRMPRILLSLAKVLDEGIAKALAVFLALKIYLVGGQLSPSNMQEFDSAERWASPIGTGWDHIMPSQAVTEHSFLRRIKTAAWLLISPLSWSLAFAGNVTLAFYSFVPTNSFAFALPLLASLFVVGMTVWGVQSGRHWAQFLWYGDHTGWDQMYRVPTGQLSFSTGRLIPAWSEIAVTAHQDRNKDIASVDPETGELSANVDRISRLPAWLQRSILTHMVVLRRRALARRAERREGQPFVYDFLTWLKDQGMAYSTQLRFLPKDIRNPNRPIPPDVRHKMAYDEKILQNEAWLPPLDQNAQVILDVPVRRVAGREIPLVDYRRAPFGSFRKPWHIDAEATGVRRIDYPRDPKSFYFGSDPVDVRVASLFSWSSHGKGWVDRLNRAPIYRYHGMLVPVEPENQRFRATDAQAMIDYAAEAEDPNTTVAMQTMFAGASQNTKHLHIRFGPFFSFKLAARPMTRAHGVEIGFLQSRTRWVASLLRFIGLGRWIPDEPAAFISVRGQDPQELKAAVVRVTEALEREGIPFGVTYQRGHFIVNPIRNESDEKTSNRLGYSITGPTEQTYREVWETLDDTAYFQYLQRTGYPVQTIESLLQSSFGLPSKSVEDPRDAVLKRQANFPLDGVQGIIEGKTVLITGGGGNLARALSDQLVDLHAKRIILIDRNEEWLANAVERLRGIAHERGIPVEITSLVGDAKNSEWVHKVFQEQKPQLVFHLAADIQVPFVQKNPFLGVPNNVLGTWNVAQAARQAGSVERFVFVASYKAGWPVMLYDTTKRIGEMIVHHQLEGTPIRYGIARFGNILEKSAVIKEFEANANRQEVITIKNPGAAAYFMRREEAARLMLTAALMGEQGEDFILDMGQPIGIAELAQAIIRQGGRVPQAGDNYVLGEGREQERSADTLFETSVTDPQRFGDVIRFHSQTYVQRSDSFNTLMEQLQALALQQGPQTVDQANRLLNEMLSLAEPSTRHSLVPEQLAMTGVLSLYMPLEAISAFLAHELGHLISYNLLYPIAWVLARVRGRTLPQWRSPSESFYIDSEYGVGFNFPTLEVRGLDLFVESAGMLANAAVAIGILIHAGPHSYMWSHIAMIVIGLLPFSNSDSRHLFETMHGMQYSLAST